MPNMPLHAHHHAKDLGSRGDSGFALVAAIVILFIVGVLTTVAIAAALSTASSGTRDEQHKAAMAAAEAGLRVATYRLTMLAPTKEEKPQYEEYSSKCIAPGSSEALAPASSGYCEASGKVEHLGNGASYTYATSRVLKESAAPTTCAGVEVRSNSKSASILQRCVIATGEVNGVKQRLEARVATVATKHLFEFKRAVTGKQKVSIEGSATLEGTIASNGKIETGAKGEQVGTGERSCELGWPSGSFKGNVCVEGNELRSQEQGEIVLTAVNPGNSWETGKECAPEPELLPKKGNCNWRIENGIYNSGLKGKGGQRTPYDSVSGKLTYTATHRELTMTGGSSLTLGGGIYNFCSLISTGNSTLAVAPNVKTEIFIGSPDCPGGTGKLEFKGNLENASGDATALQIYVYGKGEVSIQGNAKTAAILDAPEATVSLQGSGKEEYSFEGGIIGNTVEIKGNSKFKWNEKVESVAAGEAGSVTAFYRTAWTQCKPEKSSLTETC